MSWIKNIASDYVLLALVVFLASFKEAYDFVLPLPFYVIAVQQYANGIIAAVMLFCIVRRMALTRIIFHRGQWPLLAMCMFQLLVAAFTDEESAMVRFGFITVIFLYFLLVIYDRPFMREEGGSTIRSVWYGTAGFVAVNLVLYLLMPDTVMWKERLFGVSAHPNFTGIVASICVALSLCFVYVKRGRMRNWLVPLCVAALALWVCILSGSRTAQGGAALAVAVLCFFLIRNLQVRVLAVLAVLVAAVIVLAPLSIDALAVGERGNTREETWAELWATAKQLPLLGQGRTGATTNTFLYAIVAGGVIGALFFYAVVLTQISKCFSLGTGGYGLLIFRVVLIMLLGEAVLEGFLLDVIGVQILAWWVLLCFPGSDERKQIQCVNSNALDNEGSLFNRYAQRSAG